MKKPPLWATIFTVFGIIVLCSLGTWQLKRLSWKNDIIAQLDQAYANPVTNPDLSELEENDKIVASISGELLFQKTLRLGHIVQDQKPGQYIISFLKTDHGILPINLGFIATNMELKDHPLQTLKNLEVSGLIKTPEWNSFTPENKPEENIWYRLDTEQIADNQNLKNLLPLVMRVEKINASIDAKDLSLHKRWQPNNNHAQYAFFWFTLATALAAIFTLRFIRQ